MNLLIENGIKKERLSIKGYGSTNPVADNSTETDRAQNRRVTIRKV
jgi:outer membrane protein OmpA-like peptidoglycan-associated protein